MYEVFRSGCCLVLLSLIAAPVLARERAFRVLNQSNGLPVSSLSGFTQDADGFFWFGTSAGLYRYDGVEFRRWAADKLRGGFFEIRAGPTGEVLVISSPNHALYRVLPTQDAEIVTGPHGKIFDYIHDAEFTQNGRLWITQQDALFYRNEQQQWTEMLPELRGSENITNLAASFDGALWVAATHSIWKIDPDLHYKKILTRNFDGYISNVIAHPDGSFFYMEKYLDGGKIFQVHGGHVTERVALKTNLHYFALRGDTVWASGDSYLVALRPNREPEILKAGEGTPVGGLMVIDHEGSFWTGDGREIFQMPEPETEIWTEHDGLPPLAPIDLHATDEGIWVSTWKGLGHLGRTNGDDWRAFNDHLTHKGEMCSDGDGALWLYDFHDFWKRTQGRFIQYPQETGGWANGCDRGRDGTVWITSSFGLWRSQPRSSPTLVTHPFDDKDLGAVFEDSKGRLWLTRNGDICHTAVDSVRPGSKLDWICDVIDGATSIAKPVELPDGSLWAGTDLRGVWRYADDTHWKRIPASDELISQSTGRLVPSPSGGIWILGPDTRIRVIPRPDLPNGWQVVEELSVLQGIPPGGVSDLIEGTDGSLWITAGNGIAHMPASARYPKLSPPRVKVVDLLINGKRILDPLARTEVPAGHNQIEVQFAALSYRDRNLLKYQYRLHSTEQWTHSTSNLPVFRFFDLRPGEYSVEVRASLDGVHWTNEPMRLALTVWPPWYQRWWFIALVVLLITSSVYLAHRTRVAFLLRLERQRSRIAMDLHDEIGSGLGSIGILSSVATSPTVSHSQREEMTKRIAETADELGSSLTDIVWSLRSDTITIEMLAFHLTRRAESLFSDDVTQFITEFPDDWPSINLSIAVKRNVLLIAMESLHNAAKYARAETVRLHFAPADGSNWLMRLADDGCGLSHDARDSSSGMGMQTMQRRAKEIGAKLSITSQNGRGTIVSLVFNPHAKEQA